MIISLSWTFFLLIPAIYFLQRNNQCLFLPHLCNVKSTRIVFDAERSPLAFIIPPTVTSKHLSLSDSYFSEGRKRMNERKLYCSSTQANNALLDPLQASRLDQPRSTILSPKTHIIVAHRHCLIWTCAQNCNFHFIQLWARFSTVVYLRIPFAQLSHENNADKLIGDLLGDKCGGLGGGEGGRNSQSHIECFTSLQQTIIDVRNHLSVILGKRNGNNK